MGKWLYKRTLSIVLVLTLLLPYPGAFASAAENGSGEASRGAFGLPEASDLTEGSAEYLEAEQNAPYGSTGNVVPLFVKSELYMTYGWSGSKRYTHVFDYNRDSTDTGMTDFMTRDDTFEELENKYRTKFSANGTGGVLAMDTAAVNTGSGKQEYVAVLGVGKSASYVELRDKNDALVSNTMSLGSKAYLTDYAFELGGFAAIAAGDFDGDGVDSIIYYNPPTSGAKDGHVSEYGITANGDGTFTLSDIAYVIPQSIYDMFTSAGKGTVAKDIPVVHLTAADVDKDSYDELIVTLGRNDVASGDIYCGTQVLIYDKLDGGWTQTARYAPTAASSFAMNSVTAASQAKRYVWSTSSVGNVIVSDDSSTGTDFPEIVTAGWIDINMDGSNGKNIALDEKTLGVTIVRCAGMTEVYSGQKNYQGVYELVHSQTIEANGWTQAGCYDEDDRNSLMQVKCFSYLGGAQAEAIFLSGSVYAWNDGNGDGSLDHQYTYDYFDDGDSYIGSTKITNKQIQSVAVGNFDGNCDGREQVVFANLVKKSGSTSHYVSFYVYGYAQDGETNEWRGSEVDGWPVSGKDGVYVSLTDFDYDDDSVLVRYKGVERQWQDYEIMAILQPQPYFAELGDDLGEGRTAYGKSSTTGSGSQHSHGLNTTVVAGWESESGRGVWGGGVETTAENNLTWATDVQNAVEHTVDYENNTGENAVVVYRVPVLVYAYENVSNGLNMAVGKTLPPQATLISVEQYNEEAEANDLPLIDESKLVTAGDPFSYPSYASQIKNTGGTDVLVSKSGWQELTDGNIEQSITLTTETEKSFEHEFSLNVVGWATKFGFKIGGGAGYTYTHGHSKLNGAGTEYSGSVNGPTADGYGFNWNFAMWNMMVGSTKVPVLGYLVKDVIAPASPPTDVDVEYDTLTSSSATLTWTAGRRPAAEYRIYRVMSDGSYAYLASVSGDETACTISGLGESMTYTFAVRAYNDGAESVDSESVTFKTPKANGASYVTIGKVKDRTVSAGGNAVFSAVVTKSDPNAILSMQWQEREASSGEWTDIEDADSNVLSVDAAQLAQDGTKYRLRVSVVTLQESSPVYYFSNAATLRVGALDTSVGAVSLAMSGAPLANAGSGTVDAPYIGIADWSLAGTKTETITVDEPVTTKNSGGVTMTLYFHPDHPASAEDEYAYFLGVYKDADGTEHYEQVTIQNATGSQFTASGEVGYIKYMTKDGTPVDAMKRSYAALGVITREVDGKTYTQVATRSGSTVTCYWESGGVYYTYDAATETYAPAANVAPKYYVCYHAPSDGVWLLSDIVDEAKASGESTAESAAATEAYFTLVSGTDVYTEIVTEPYVKRTANGSEFYPLSDYIVYTKPAEKDITFTTLTPQAGTVLTLSAAVTSSGRTLAGHSAFFLITNTADGTSFRIEGTTDVDGRLMGEWIAPSAGLYTIRAGANASENYCAAASDAVYYAALGKDTAGDVQPTAYIAPRIGDALGAYTGASVTYGTTLYFETYTVDADGMVTSGGAAECVALPDGTEQALTDGSYTPPRAGVFTAEGGDGKLLFTVAPRALKVTPTLTATIPASLDDFELELTGAFETDEVSLRSLLAVQDENDYFSPGGGVFTFTPIWSEDDDDAEEIQRLTSAYSVTLGSISLRRELGALPIVYRVAASGHGTLYGFYGNSMTSFATGTEMAEGTKLVFQANPEAGYRVDSWTVNGAEVAENDALYRVETQDGSNRRTLTIDSLAVEDADRLMVEVSFTEQFSAVSFGAGENGTLRARTAAGTEITSGTKLTYGSSVTFAAEPSDGWMIDGWTVNGETCCWANTTVPYRETTLTLSGLGLESYAVAVSFTMQKTLTAAAPGMIDANGNSVTAGSIAITNAASGAAIAAGSSVTQGAVLTYTAAFADAGFNAVSRWEYSTDGTTWHSGGSGASFTIYTGELMLGESAELRVRAIVSVAETKAIGWSISAPDGASASLTATSGSVTLTNGGSYPVGTPVTFTLTLDARYQAAWSDNVTPSADGLSATVILSADSTVTVTVTAKPVTPTESILAAPVLPSGSVEGTVRITVANGGFITDGVTENEITVTSSDITCALIVVTTDESGNVTYRRITASAVDGSTDTYRFKTVLVASERILAAVKGDMPVNGELDGKIGNAEILQTKRAALQDSWTDSELAWVDVYGDDGKINNKDILTIKRAAIGTSPKW